MYYIKIYCCDAYCYDINCAFVGCNKKNICDPRLHFFVVFNYCLFVTLRRLFYNLCVLSFSLGS